MIDENYRLSFTYRKYLGVDCKTIKENVAIKQQLELMKMCGRVNAILVLHRMKTLDY